MILQVDQAEGLGGLILPYGQVDFFSQFPLVGTGEITSQHCGLPRKLAACSAGHRRVFYHSCNKWSCPSCFISSVSRAARRCGERIDTVKAAYRGSGHRLGQAHQFILSPNKEDYILPFEQLKAKAVTFAQKIGISAGAVVFHPYRIKDRYNSPLRMHLKELPKAQRRGVWNLVRTNALNLSSWKDYVVYEPHFHIIGFMPAVLQKSDDFYNKTGWIYKNSTYKEGGLKSVRGAAAYLLTHAAYIPNKKTITYFGLASYNKIVVERVNPRYEQLTCKECGLPMFLHLGWSTDNEHLIIDYGEPVGDFLIKVYDLRYRLKPVKLKCI